MSDDDQAGPSCPARPLSGIEMLAAIPQIFSVFKGFGWAVEEGLARTGTTKKDMYLEAAGQCLKDMRKAPGAAAKWNQYRFISQAFDLGGIYLPDGLEALKTSRKELMSEIAEAYIGEMKNAFSASGKASAVYLATEAWREGGTYIETGLEKIGSSKKEIYSEIAAAYLRDSRKATSGDFKKINADCVMKNLKLITGVPLDQSLKEIGATRQAIYLGVAMAYIRDIKKYTDSVAREQTYRKALQAIQDGSIGIQPGKNPRSTLTRLRMFAAAQGLTARATKSPAQASVRPASRAKTPSIPALAG